LAVIDFIGWARTLSKVSRLRLQRSHPEEARAIELFCGRTIGAGTQGDWRIDS